ncbi:hypothetical protein ABTX81_05865 [Kitasatospora sp. NPDC097605]|uniref:hypothetical protein n=1 Tax=Kitasatospora sp. NPDC097605 TaxID=3157226 RepID=UPI0033236DD2
MPAEAPRNLPDVAVGHHPDHGIVAALPTQSAAAQWMLERLEFQRVPDHPSLYALTDQHRQASERAAWAVKLLNGAGYRVDTDMSLAPENTDRRERTQTRPTAVEPEHAQAPDTGPDVAFAEHPTLGIVAAVGNHYPFSPGIFLDTDGWRHHRDLDVYLSPPAATRAESLDAVARTVTGLRRGSFQVAMEPRLARDIAARRDPVSSAFTTHKFRVDGAALADSPGVRPASTAKSAGPAAPPPAPVDPRIAFVRAR